MISIALNRYFGCLLISKLLFWPVIRTHKIGLYFIQPFTSLQNLLYILTETQLVNFILIKIAKNNLKEVKIYISDQLRG